MIEFKDLETLCKQKKWAECAALGEKYFEQQSALGEPPVYRALLSIASAYSHMENFEREIELRKAIVEAVGAKAHVYCSLGEAYESAIALQPRYRDLAIETYKRAYDLRTRAANTFDKLPERIAKLESGVDPALCSIPSLYSDQFKRLQQAGFLSGLTENEALRVLRREYGLEHLEDNDYSPETAITQLLSLTNRFLSFDSKSKIADIMDKVNLVLEPLRLFFTGKMDGQGNISLKLQDHSEQHCLKSRSELIDLVNRMLTQHGCSENFFMLPCDCDYAYVFCTPQQWQSIEC